jgi:hypothetical protein
MENVNLISLPFIGLVGGFLSGFLGRRVVRSLS